MAASRSRSYRKDSFDIPQPHCQGMGAWSFLLSALAHGIAGRAILAVASVAPITVVASVTSVTVIAPVAVVAPITVIAVIAVIASVTLPLAMPAMFIMLACFPIAPIPIPTPVVVALTVPAGCNHNLLPRHVNRTWSDIHRRRCDVDRARYPNIDIKVDRVSDAGHAQQGESSRRKKIGKLVHGAQQ
jgi:hypothetical protein